MRIRVTDTREATAGSDVRAIDMCKDSPGIALFLALLLWAGNSEAVSPNSQHDDFPVPLARTAGNVQLLWSRLKSGLPQELYDNFDLFIYVNKAERGSWSQHLYAFAKPSSANPERDVILMMDAPVSTGREAMERAKDGQIVSTSTPSGFYELDPERFQVGHRSRQWELDMPNAMFFNLEKSGTRTGLAIHGVTDPGAIAAIGHRASAGCVQLSLDGSRKLFDLVRDNFEGAVPRFAYFPGTRTTNNTGELARDRSGQIVMEQGYRALVIIEDVESTPPISQLLVSAMPQSEKLALVIRQPAHAQATGALPQP